MGAVENIQESGEKWGGVGKYIREQYIREGSYKNGGARLVMLLENNKRGYIREGIIVYKSGVKICGDMQYIRVYIRECIKGGRSI